MMNKMMLTEEEMMKVAGGADNSITWAELGDPEVAELLSGYCPYCHQPITYIDDTHRKCEHCNTPFVYMMAFEHGSTHMAWCSPL